MQRPIVLFLTGHIGSGKTTVGRFFSKRGAQIISADAISAQLLRENDELIASIASTFGAEEVLTEGAIDKGKLGSLVFSNPQALAKLEAIEMPYILVKTQKEIEQAKASYVVVEIPLLDRAQELLSLADEIVLVEAPEKTKKERVAKRDGKHVLFEKRLQAQPDIEWLRKKASLRIQNEGTIEELERSVDALFSRIKRKHSHE